MSGSKPTPSEALSELQSCLEEVRVRLANNRTRAVQLAEESKNEKRDSELEQLRDELINLQGERMHLERTIAMVRMFGGES